MINATSLLKDPLTTKTAILVKDWGDDFNLSHVETSTHIYGPGARFVIWFQGCALACKGCWNKEMWSFKNNQLLNKARLLEQILQAENIQGVTFLGGEPLHQSDNLWWLIEQIRLRSSLTLFLFTGYEEEELAQSNLYSKMLELCDIIAFGPYDEQKRNTQQQWIGSDNQRIFYPKNSREAVQPEAINQVEIIIEKDERLRILGFPDNLLLDLINSNTDEP